MIDYRDICLKVCDIAREAGEYIAGERENFSPSKVEYKGLHNLVSYVDREAEVRIVSALSKLIYGVGYITEEGTAVSSNEYLKWVIDPLDGTTNFVHGLPPYCVSIALMEGDEIVVGVVYEITLKEIFYAWRGSVAYRNGYIAKVSGTQQLKDSLIAVGFSHDTHADTERYLETMAYFQKNSNGIRRLGSAAADIAYVACGRLDGFFQAKLSPWDVAAGAFIAKAAGAMVSDYSGGGNWLFGGEIIVSTPAIYGDIYDRDK